MAVAATRRLGQIAAEILGYKPRPDGSMQDRYRPNTPGIRPTKEQLEPGVTADSESVTITDRNYQVTFYLYFARSGGMVFNGVRIKGDVDNDNVNKVIVAWNIPRIFDEYDKKLKFLRENPGFRTPLFQKTPQKRVYASEVE